MEIYAMIAFICSGRIDDKRACDLTYMVVYTNFSPTVNKVCKLNDQQHTSLKLSTVPKYISPLEYGHDP